MLRKVLLICGILASLLYISINIIIPIQWDEYNSASQTVSELSAIGAPTRTVWNLACSPYTVLMIAFAIGILLSAKNSRHLRIAARLLIAYGLLGFLWPFVPMHMRETLAAGGSTFSDTMHIALGVVTEILFLLALGFAAAAFGKGFRIYCIATFILLLFFGILTFLDAPKVGLNQPTPMIGVWERINIGLFLLWVIVLAVILLRKRKLQIK